MRLNYLSILLFFAFAGWAQADETLSDSTGMMLRQNIDIKAEHQTASTLEANANGWLTEISIRLQKQIPDIEYRIDFLKVLHYEAMRAGLDPALVLALIEVKSGFNKNALSKSGAQGYMQVMPFWVKKIGTSDQNLFHLRTNLRYGCTILRYYLAIEDGDLFRALGRYDGNVGKPEFPNMVKAAWDKHWSVPDK